MTTATADRVRANTSTAINGQLDLDAQDRLRTAATSAAAPDQLSQRISAVDQEWDFDRVLETEAGTMGLVGLTLGVAVDRRFLPLAGMVSAMLVLHATQGWYPLLPLFRRAGVRSRSEIDRERYALQAMRGDFAQVPQTGAASERAAAAWRAVNEPGDAAGEKDRTDTDRVRAQSDASGNEKIDRETRERLAQHATEGRDAIAGRIAALDREWDVERILQMNAGLFSLSGIVLGGLVDRRFLLLSATVYGFFVQHAIQGWCPPLPMFRRLGVRTRREINREKYALKALRGDFDTLGRPPAAAGEYES